MMNAHDVSVAVFARGLATLKAIARKAEAHAAATGADPQALLGAKLAEDMHSFAIQAHWACEGARLAVARLLGQEVSPRADAPQSFDALAARVDEALSFLGEVSAEALDAGLSRTIELRHRGAVTTSRGGEFLTQFAVPSFYFHLVTAYGILRAQGVPLQKGDFLGA